MPIWIFVCIWIIWVLVTGVFALSFYAIAEHNKNEIKVLFEGKAEVDGTGYMRILTFVIASIFWIGYNVSLFF